MPHEPSSKLQAHLHLRIMHTLHTPDRIIESIILQAIRNPGLPQGDVSPVGELQAVGAFVVSNFSAN